MICHRPRCLRSTIGVLLTALVLVSAAACQHTQPSTAAATTPPAAASPSPSPSSRELELPATLGGLPVNTGRGMDWGMALSLKLAFPQAGATAGASYKSQKGYVLLVGVAITDTTDQKAAIDNAFASMAPYQGHATLGLYAPKTTHAVSPGSLGGTVLCGLADGGGADFPVCAWAGDGIVGLVAYMENTDHKYVETRILSIRAEVIAAMKQA